MIMLIISIVLFVIVLILLLYSGSRLKKILPFLLLFAIIVSAQEDEAPLIDDGEDFQLSGDDGKPLVFPQIAIAAEELTRDILGEQAAIDLKTTIFLDYSNQSLNISFHKDNITIIA